MQHLVKELEVFPSFGELAQTLDLPILSEISAVDLNTKVDLELHELFPTLMSVFAELTASDDWAKVLDITFLVDSDRFALRSRVYLLEIESAYGLIASIEDVSNVVSYFSQLRFMEDCKAIVEFTYRNWKGHVSQRMVDTTDGKLQIKSSKYHPEAGLSLFYTAHDLAKNETRSFLIKDILSGVIKCQ